MRRIILFAASMVVLAPAIGWGALATVRSGVKKEVAWHWQNGPDCQPVQIEIEFLERPANGTVTSERKDVVVPKENSKGEAQRCVGRTVQGVAVFYQSEPGFKGLDSFKYRRFNPKNAKDRFNVEVEYIVTVE